MKYFLFLSLFALFLSGCADTARPEVKNQPPADQPPTAQKPGNELSAISHSSENQFPPSKMPGNSDANSGPASGGGSPMARAIDVSAMTSSIQRLEKAYKKSPKDLEVKVALADAYFNRATALTDAAQYRAALADFRKGLKLNPDDKEAKDMHDQIISIFKSIGREPPQEGEEPPPLPFK